MPRACSPLAPQRGSAATHTPAQCPRAVRRKRHLAGGSSADPSCPRAREGRCSGRTWRAATAGAHRLQHSTAWRSGSAAPAARIPSACDLRARTPALQDGGRARIALRGMVPAAPRGAVAPARAPSPGPTPVALRPGAPWPDTHDTTVCNTAHAHRKHPRDKGTGVSPRADGARGPSNRRDPPR